MILPATARRRSAATADAVDVVLPSPRTILLATDLSPASAAAESEAIGLARDLRASLLVLSVIDPRSLRGARGQWIQRIDQARAALTIRSRDVVEQARAAGIPVRLLIWEGDPAEMIVDAAVAESADYIVVGSHGRRGVDRILLGSVSDRVVREAPVPVVVARRRETAPRA